MTKAEILNLISDAADETLPAIPDHCSEQEKADFSNKVIEILMKTVNPDRETKPAIRF